MSFEKYLVPVSVDDGYNYQSRDNGEIVGKATLVDGDWNAMPHENGFPDRDKSMTFKRLAAAEYYLLAVFFDRAD